MMEWLRFIWVNKGFLGFGTVNLYLKGRVIFFLFSFLIRITSKIYFCLVELLIKDKIITQYKHIDNIPTPTLLWKLFITSKADSFLPIKPAKELDGSDETEYKN